LRTTKDVMPYAFPRLWFNPTKYIGRLLCLDASRERIRGVNHILPPSANVMLDAVARNAIQPCHICSDCFPPYIHDIEVDDFWCGFEDLVFRHRRVHWRWRRFLSPCYKAARQQRNCWQKGDWQDPRPEMGIKQA